jgi:hypothetical protein
MSCDVCPARRTATEQHYRDRLATIVTHPAFQRLSRTDKGEYRLAMLTPLNGAWSAEGSLASVIDRSEELPLEG